MSKDLPWMKFDPVKASTEPALRMCSRNARLLYFDLLKYMHHSSPYGHVLVKGRALTPADLAADLGCSEAENAVWLAELIEHGVLELTPAGVAYCPRMVRDADARERARDAGSLGGNPALLRRSEMLDCATRDATRRMSDAERQRRCRERKRAAKIAERHGHTDVTAPIRNEWRDRVTVTRDAVTPNVDKNPDFSSRVTGISVTQPLEVREESIDSSPERESVSPAVAPLAAHSGGATEVPPNPAKALRERALEALKDWRSGKQAAPGLEPPTPSLRVFSAMDGGLSEAAQDPEQQARRSA